MPTTLATHKKDKKDKEMKEFDNTKKIPKTKSDDHKNKLEKKSKKSYSSSESDSSESEVETKNEKKNKTGDFQEIKSISDEPISTDGPILLSKDEWRKKNNVTVEGDIDPAPYQLFSEFRVPKILNHVFQNFTQPTVIQAQCWPIAETGRDLIGLASTGSGKTLSFLLPALNRIMSIPKRPSYQATPIALVIAPTRELAQQIEEVCKGVIRGTTVRALCCYGGLGKYEQARTLRNGVDIVIGTPGRLNDLLTDRHLKTVEFLVLDEADRMLDMGFLPQIESLVKYVPDERQTLMFSATWPKEVQRLASDFQKKPVKVTVGNTELTGNLNVKQHFYDCDGQDRIQVNKSFVQIIHDIKQKSENGSNQLIIVFCNEKYKCDDLQHELKVEHNIQSIVLHSGKLQQQREQGLRLFRTHKVPVLIATDVAARGLDIPDVKAVINYGFPKNIEDYVHRIGRTGRAGKTGDAHSFLYPRTESNLRELVDILIRSKQEIPAFLERFKRAPKTNNGRMQFGRRGGNGGGRSWGNNGGVGRSFKNDYKSDYNGGGNGGGRSWGNNNGGGNGGGRSWGNNRGNGVSWGNNSN